MIKRIRGFATRKGRDESGLFFAEGIRIIGEAAEHGASIEQLVVAPGLLASEYGQRLVRDLSAAGVSYAEVSADVFRSLAGKEGPQGIGAVVHQDWEPLDAIDPDAGLCTVALDRVQDPGNLGTILRTADATGAETVILLGNSTDPYDPTAVRASMGAIFTRHLVRATFDEAVTWARDRAVQIVGTSDAALTGYREATYRRPLLLLMGSEREGLSAGQQAACDQVVSIPMLGSADSLNLAVATGVMLYELLAVRR